MRSRVVALLVAALAVTLTACGDSGSSSSGDATLNPGQAYNGPPISFVGSSDASCPAQGQQPYSPMPPNANSLPAVGTAIDEMPHGHVNPPAKVSYAHNPPTSGCHYNLGYGKAPIAAGVYPASPVTPAEYWVHNLEHGYVVVLYKCQTNCDSDISTLRSWYRSLPPDPGLVQAAKQGASVQPYVKVIIIPWPTMDPPYAAVSWDYYLPLQTLDTSMVQKFYDNHVGHSPEGATSTP